MSADIVLGGLGGDGPIVTGGLGLTAAPDPNALRATITASGALQATLSAAGGNALTAPHSPGLQASQRRSQTPTPPRFPRASRAAASSGARR